MPVSVIGQLRDAFRALEPKRVQAVAERPVTFGVLAADEHCVDEIHDFLFPPPRRFSGENMLRIAAEDDFARATAGFSEWGIPHPAHFYNFDFQAPRQSAAVLLDNHETDWLPLANSFPGFRRQVSERLILKVAKENALFAVATSLPNVVPSILVLPWSVGEFASDTAFLTMNQVRLSFMLAAAHGQEVGYDRQTLKIGSIIGAAFGWRALARELVSKIPVGGGLIPKALIAFAGTYAIGRGLEHWFRDGSLLGAGATRQHYEEARRIGRETVEGIVESAMASAKPAHRSA